MFQPAVENWRIYSKQVRVQQPFPFSHIQLIQSSTGTLESSLSPLNASPIVTYFWFQFGPPSLEANIWVPMAHWILNILHHPQFYHFVTEASCCGAILKSAWRYWAILSHHGALFNLILSCQLLHIRAQQSFWFSGSNCFKWRVSYTNLFVIHVSFFPGNYWTDGNLGNHQKATLSPPRMRAEHILSRLFLMLKLFRFWQPRE